GATDTHVAIVGMGYVGLPTALAFLDKGATVTGIDISAARLAEIRSARADLLEDDRHRLRAALASPGLELTGDPSAMSAADTVIICVPTPVDQHLNPDLTALRAACATVVGYARPGQTIVLTSTTYVGTTHDLLVDPLAARGLVAGQDVFVAFAPERVDPGVDQHRQELTPRVVGGVTAACTARAAAVLEHITPLVHTVSSAQAAEMTKLLENTFRAVNIALANEFADACRALRVDVNEVIASAATKPYGFMAFHPGPGVGGHCIPCDPHYLLWQLRAQRHESTLIDAAMRGIAGRPRHVVDRAREVLADRATPLAGARILVVGVAYKPGVADVRESPALQIIDELVAAGARVSFVDEMVDRVRLARGTMSGTADYATRDWDLVLVHTPQPGVDEAWLRTQPAVLDASYRLHDVPLREVV
ncbi:MAG TPA: nucleotide sugar dehydrogenase, partial [Rugosimonospora sp.]|nr:nucleotide sugar dehydrogenase [Rugosimonospora sp.]